MTSNSDQPQEKSQDVTTETPSMAASRVRLTRLKVNRFRHVKPGTELRFDDGINVLLGRNGTGKTTLLELVCALVRGDLEAYQQESFDLEFDVRCRDRCFMVSAQNTVSFASILAGLDRHERPQSWTFHVEFHGPSARLATVELTPNSAFVVPAERYDHQPFTTKRSLFDLMFYVRPFLHIWPTDPSPVSQSATDLLEIFSNCLRLDEGIDVFRSIVGGSILPNVDMPLSIGISTRGASEATEWYAPQGLITHILSQGLSAHETTEVAVGQSDFGVLDAVARAVGVKEVRCSLMLLNRKQDTDSGTTVSNFGKPSFWITTNRGTTYTHEQLSYGEKRLLTFLYHAAANPEVLVADELVNGMHYEWIDACLAAIQGQAFLTSQNPLLLDHLSFESAEEVQRRFVLCDRDEDGSWIWRNMDLDAADAFYRAYEVGLQHVGEILRTSGLW